MNLMEKTIVNACIFVRNKDIIYELLSFIFIMKLRYYVGICIGK